MQQAEGDVVMNNGEEHPTAAQVPSNTVQETQGDINMNGQTNGQTIVNQVQQTTQQTITLSDETLVNGARWDVLKETAMKEDY